MPDLSAEGRGASSAELEAILAKVDQVHASAVGFAGLESDTYRAYRLLLERGEEAIPAFERLQTSGTAAARLYASQGLRRLGRTESARRGLELLQDWEEPVGYLAGCMMLNPKVGELARQWRDSPDVYL